MPERKEAIRAVLRSETAPDPEQEARFLAFLQKKYGGNVSLTWKNDSAIRRGFRLEVGSDVYDWTLEGRFEQFRNSLYKLRGKDVDVIPLLRESVASWTPQALAEEIGTVCTVGDGIATVSGLENAFYGEILIFSGGIRGMVQNLGEKEIGCILFDDEDGILAGSTVRRTGRIAGMPCGNAFLGRVVNALGVPIDGKGAIPSDAYRPVESPAPAIIDREPVNQPLETGILAIDAMFPIGKGQRELIIGDRQTGKTAIATDTILNQKGKNVVCIYVAIGQKAGSVAGLAKMLADHGAMDYTVIVSATAGESAPLQYLAPYAGCTLAEYFMEAGRDVLIVYDDLSKHAVAYRAISLLLGRAPGREAYPGDVFYLHSRLLERSAHLSAARGGGSMTALPIVETQAGDVSAYIPTNIISITDGQIFLESSLFFSGQRPAVNVGLSVSRVGGDAQTKAMKKAVGTLRLDLAQYREMEVFTQFSGDLDETTRAQLRYGQNLLRMLRQEQAAPYSLAEETAILTAFLERKFADLPPEDVPQKICDFRARLRTDHGELCERINRTGLLSPDDRDEILAAAQAVT